ncbi:hypothetical protein QFC21_006776 [Naganishia friedmannii]|uniref:Uncharacterized protein n=1 Tax=Naganishia friedmannii TaxID=89922 RepID=A0ACC2UZP0_9TREE|nr:hypothetical protein QFC21_006776 [Naganishia friedmannii]
MASRLVRYFDNHLLAGTQKVEDKRSILRSLKHATLMFTVLCTYALAFWFGGIEVRRGLHVGKVMTAFLYSASTVFTLANLVPQMTQIAGAIVTLKEIRRQIERQPSIDIRNHDGFKGSNGDWKPSFSLENVVFAYPSRPCIPVLNGVSVSIESGKMTAYVGPSGSGKSTILSLLMREYDPAAANIANVSDAVPPRSDSDDESSQHDDVNGKQSAASTASNVDLEKATPLGSKPRVQGCGTVRCAHRNLQEYNLRWLRSRIRVVSQEPRLFSSTIFDNVAAGLTGTSLEYHPDIDGVPATTDLIRRTAEIRNLCIAALIKAEAWDFVQKLPEGIDTVLGGQSSSGLSGGQRQRIAIARALVCSPACLLMDEATSALDTGTEEKIQRMLENEAARTGMTVVWIAHRLSTVTRADKIVVVRDGAIVDQGGYAQLMDGRRTDQTFRKMALTQDMTDAPTELDNSSSHTHSCVIQGETPMVELITQRRASTRLAARSEKDPSLRHPSMSQVDSNLPSNETEHEDNKFKFFSLLKTQKWLFPGGVLGAMMAGASFPLAAWMAGHALSTLKNRDIHPGVNTWAMWLFITASLIWVVNIINILCLEFGSVRIVRKMKLDNMKALLRQEIGFFEQGGSSSGGLASSAVSVHPSNVGGVTGLVSTQSIVILVNLTGAVAMGLALDWRTAIVGLPLIVVLFVSGWLNTTMLERYESDTSQSALQLADYINEATDSIKTIVALGRESETMRLLAVKAQAAPSGTQYLMLGACGFALAQAMVMWMGALMFYRASQRIAAHVSIDKIYAVIEAGFMAASASGRLFTFLGDYARAISSFKAMKDWASGDIVLWVFLNDKGATET